MRKSRKGCFEVSCGAFKKWLRRACFRGKFAFKSMENG
jgi:hypothetical protein